MSLAIRLYTITYNESDVVTVFFVNFLSEKKSLSHASISQLLIHPYVSIRLGETDRIHVVTPGYEKKYCWTCLFAASPTVCVV